MSHDNESACGVMQRPFRSCQVEGSEVTGGACEVHVRVSARTAREIVGQSSRRRHGSTDELSFSQLQLQALVSPRTSRTRVRHHEFGPQGSAARSPNPRVSPISVATVTPNEQVAAMYLSGHPNNEHRVASHKPTATCYTSSTQVSARTPPSAAGVDCSSASCLPTANVGFEQPVSMP